MRFRRPGWGDVEFAALAILIALGLIASLLGLGAAAAEFFALWLAR